MKTTRIKLNINLIAFLILMFLLSFARQSKGQNLEFSTMVQQTTMGLQSGYSVEYRTALGPAIGAFYQSTNHLSFETTPENYPFYGVDLSTPVKRCGDLELLAHLRVGLVNQNFLIATPELETRLSIFDFLKVGLGAGYRSRQAAVSAKLILTTF